MWIANLIKCDWVRTEIFFGEKEKKREAEHAIWLRQMRENGMVICESWYIE